MVDVFTKKLLLVADRHIPSKYITVNDKESPWITPAVRAAINRNKRVYKKWVIRGKSPTGKHQVNVVQNEHNKIIKEAKKTYIGNLCVKICDPRSGGKLFWNADK